MSTSSASSSEAGAAWRTCPQCGGVQVYYGKVSVAPNIPLVKFERHGELAVKCNYCGKILPAQ